MQLLQLRYAPPAAGDYREFMESLGMHQMAVPQFHPFWHEIVSVDEQAAPIAIVSEFWPAYALGSLLITRAGCAVTAGPDQFTKEIAEHSTLYWALTRPNRPTADLSHGWGSNSAWRTSFRRDYALDGAFHYNVDAKPKGTPPADDDLDAMERLELLRFRCFVKCAKPDHDRWPYDDSWIEPS